MLKTYTAKKDSWLASKVANFFNEKYYIGTEQAFLSNKNNLQLLLIPFGSLFVSMLLTGYSFFGLQQSKFGLDFIEEYGEITAIFGFFAIIFVVFFVSFIVTLKISVKLFGKPIIKRLENVTHYHILHNEVKYITLTDDHIIVNYYNREDSYIKIPIQNINNIYYMYGNLKIYNDKNWLLPDEQDEMIGFLFTGYREPTKSRRTESISENVRINGKIVTVTVPHGLYTMENNIDVYRKEFNIQMPDIDYLINNGRFLFIFTKDHDFLLLYVPFEIIEQGFIRDLNDVLRYGINKEILTPVLYKEKYPNEKIFGIFKPSEDYQYLNELREELRLLK